MRPERMHEITLLVRNEDRQRVVRELARAKAVHLVDHKKERVSETDVDIGSPAESAEILSDTLTKTRSMLAKLYTSDEDVAPPRTLSDRIVRINQLADQYAAFEQQLSGIADEETLLQQREELLRLLPEIQGQIRSLFTVQHVRTLLLKGNTDKLAVALDPVFLLKNTRAGSALIGVKEQHDIDGLIAAAQCTLVDISPLSSVRGTKIEALHSIHERFATLHHEREQVEREMRALSVHAKFLRESEQLLELELLKAQAPLHFGATKQVTLIRGYVPTKRLDALQEAIPEAVLISHPARHAPTSLRNPTAFSSFEDLLKLYTLPKYGELDPTAIVAVTFPVFFGFMLGDMGYGLALFLLFLWIHHLFPKGRALSEIVMISAVSTIVFGALYGEIFGLEVVFGVHLPYLIHRVSHVQDMLLIAILFGLIHINLGLILGMVNEAREGWFYAFMSKGSWMLLQVGGICALASYGVLANVPVLQSLHPPAMLGWVLMGVAVAGIAYSERLRGLLELPMILSHTLSYTRLVAIGLASVYVALVVNDLGSGLLQHGLLGIIFGSFVILIGHTVNLALGLLGPFLHSLRLHYVEFFMKFYEGGGTPYVPFGTLRG